LDFYFVSVHAVNRSGVNFRQHAAGRVTENCYAEKRQISVQTQMQRMSYRVVKYRRLLRTTSYLLTSKSPTKKFERQASNRCHQFEYLTLLNTSWDARTSDREGVGEYYVREVVEPVPSNER